MKRLIKGRGCRLFSGWLIATLLVYPSAGLGEAKPVPTLRMITAPDFSLADVKNRPHQLSDFRHHPLVIFFFCGCPWCHQCAQAWGKFQRGGALPVDTSGRPVETLIIFSGPADEASGFARETGLDPKTTVLLPDPMMRVTDAYHADVCPRVFALDPQGRVRYTNDHQDDAPRKASEMLIVSRALTALRQGAGTSGHPLR